MESNFFVPPKYRTTEDFLNQEEKETKSRHAIVMEIAGNWNIPKAGIITINSEKFVTNNVARRLDELLGELMRGRASTNKIKRIKGGRKRLALDEIRQLEISIKLLEDY